MIAWWEVFLWSSYGLFIDPAKSWASSLEHDWYAKIVVMESDGTENYSWYKLF